MKNLLIVFTLFFTSINAQVVINEFSAANYDEDDFLPGFGTNYSDWIELYNDGSTTVDISGYFLSDKLSNPQKWAIPVGTNIAAGDHLIFLADKQDGFSSGEFHTNFKLTQTKGTEYILFSNPTGTILDSIRLNYPNKKNDSRGRKTDGSSDWGIFQNPSPDASNSTNYDRYSIKPVFDQVPGFYPGTITLTLSTTEPTSSIRYTINGDNPNSGSTLYTGPITITQTTVVRAKTYSTDPDILSSHVETNTYFINETHQTKVISIAGGSGIMSLLNGTQSTPEGAFELFETDGTFLAEATGEYNKHGNDSWAYSQRGLDFVTRDQFGNNYAVLDEIFDNKNRDEFQRLILKCGASDNYPFEGQANDNYPGEFGGAHIRDAYINEMSQLGDLRVDERSNEFAVMYVNGEYWGVYDIREKVDDHDFTSHYYDQERNDLQYLKTWGGTWSEYGGAQAQTDWDDLVAFITGNDMTIPANYDYVDSVYNTGSLIDYFILNGFVVNADWLNWNTSWWRGLNPSGDKKKWRYTLWDMDATFNHYTNYSGVPNQSATADPCDPESLPNLGGQGHVPIWNALQNNETFFAEYINRYAELSSTVFSCDSMHNLLTRMTNEIAPEMPDHIAKWGGTMFEWQTNIDSLHAFIDTRCVSIVTGLVDCNPEISGPYSLTVDVQPPGSGAVQLSSMTPNNYPYTGIYFGGVDINLDADAEECWEFDHWIINNDTLYPDNFTEMVHFDIDQDDTLVAYFVPTNCIYIDVQPPGAGEVNIDGNGVNSFPSLESVSDSTNHLFDAIANPGFTFNHWDWDIHTPAPSTTSTNTVVYTYTSDTVTVYFDADLMDTIVYIVEPAGSGTISVDGSNITTFPNTGIYSDGSTSSLIATPNTGFNFDNWEFDFNTPMPNSTTSNITVTWGANDTVIVNFAMIPVDTIVYVVQPPGAGTITVDASNITTFPNAGIYNEGSTSNLSATPNTGYLFNNWDFSSNTPMPNSTTNNITVTWGANDTVFVNFDLVPVDTIVYIVQPAGSGTITVDGVNITTFPTTEIYSEGSNSSLTASPNAGFTFNNWDFSSNTPMPNTSASNISITWASNDTAYINFDAIPTYDITYLVNPVGGGNIDIDGVNTTVFPTTINYLQGTNVMLDAFDNPNFTFDYWNTNASTLIPSVNNPTVNFNVFSNDTIIANYDEFITDTLWVVMNPTGVGELVVGTDNITTSPFMGIYEVGALLQINASPLGSNIFNQWNISGLNLPDYNASTFFTFLGQDTLYAYFNNVLSIQDLGEDIASVLVYPTVVNNQLTVEITSNENTDLSIDLINISGQKIATLYNGSLRKEIAVKETFEIDAAQGVYFIKLNTNKTNVTHKIVKLK